MQPEGPHVEEPLPAIGPCGQCGSWKDGLTSLLSKVFEDLSVP